MTSTIRHDAGPPSISTAPVVLRAGIALVRGLPLPLRPDEESAMNATHSVVPDDALLLRIKAEYWAMPGLRLTPAQAARLWALDRACAWHGAHY
jgi:hypothetical protein